MALAAVTGFVAAWYWLQASSQLMYNVVENNGQTNFDAGNPNEPNNGCFFRVGGANGLMGLDVVSVGSNNDTVIQFAYGSNQFWQGYSFGTGCLQGAPVNFQSNHWYQITLTYGPTNIAVYTDRK